MRDLDSIWRAGVHAVMHAAIVMGGVLMSSCLPGGSGTAAPRERPRSLSFDLGRAPDPFPPPEAPFVLATTQGAASDVIVTPTHVYWLEVHSGSDARVAGGPRSNPSPLDLGCGDRAGALMRVHRRTEEKEAIVELDYLPVGLDYDGKRLYWTGSPCQRRPPGPADPAWLWSWEVSEGGEPVPQGDRDRRYRDVTTAPGVAYVSDRFGRGGLYRFVDGGRPQVILPEPVRALALAAEDRSLFWADAYADLWETDLDEGSSTRWVSLTTAPVEAHLFDGGLVVQTMSEVLVIGRTTRTIERRVGFADYGSRGPGALEGGRYYHWASGLDAVYRMDLQNGAVTTAVTTVAHGATGLALDAGVVFLSDVVVGAIFAWQAPPFRTSPR